MSEWHGYVLIQLKTGFTLSTAQKSQVREAVRALAVTELRLPQRMFQVRVSLDGNSAVYEAAWDRARLSAVMTTIAETLGVAPETLARNMTYQLFAEGGTREESRRAALAYLVAHADGWEPMVKRG